MKKSALFIFLIFLFLPALSNAQKLKLDIDKLGLGIAALLPAQLLQTTIHESSHAITAKAQGARTLRFSVWPHLDGGTGKFYFGRVQADWPKEPTTKQTVLFLLSPVIADTIIFSAAETLFATGAINTDSLGAPILFVFGELAPWIDFTKFFIHSGDLNRLNEKWTNVHGIRWPALLLSCIGAYLMVKRARQIFFKKEKNPVKQDLKVNTFIDKNNMGLSLQYIF